MKQYSKKQITEALAYWKGQLKKMNESTEINLETITKFRDKLEVVETMVSNSIGKKYINQVIGFLDDIADNYR